MKIDREKIKGLHVAEYAEYVFKFPLKLYCNIQDLALLKTAERRHVLANYNFHSFYISDKYKSNGFIKHYKDYKQCFENWYINHKNKLDILDKCRVEALTALILAGIYPFKDYESLTEWDIIDLLDNCKMRVNAEFAEYYYNTTLEYYRNTLNERNKFDDKASNREIERLENKNFDFVDYVINGSSCAGLFHKGVDIAMKIADELAELTYYKTLVTDNKHTEKQENNNRKTISQRLDLLKELGVFALPAFQIDNYKTDNSIRNISRLLSDILGEQEETIRTTIKRKGMSFNKGV